MARAQWIDFAYMTSKNDSIFNEVIHAYEAKNVRGVMSFQKDWNNEVIAQFYATLYVEEHEEVRKLYWMTKGLWYAHFARLLGFGRLDEDKVRLHYSNPLPTNRMRYMYARNERNLGTITGLLPFYTYLNRMIRKIIAPKEGDVNNISQYSKNLLDALSPNGVSFSVFEFIWEEIKSISRSPLKSCGFAPHILCI